jgi:hypothetical protein
MYLYVFIILITFSPDAVLERKGSKFKMEATIKKWNLNRKKMKFWFF